MAYTYLIGWRKKGYPENHSSLLGYKHSEEGRKNMGRPLGSRDSEQGRKNRSEAYYKSVLRQEQLRKVHEKNRKKK